mmetsp:Transcript_64715/g.75959  ORF Transcript_64715/g.75959 Transcript_64715/m.75959 type:complete len:185 (+) Transcript_64715:278-832(+)
MICNNEKKDDDISTKSNRTGVSNKNACNVVNFVQEIMSARSKKENIIPNMNAIIVAYNPPGNFDSKTDRLSARPLLRFISMFSNVTSVLLEEVGEKPYSGPPSVLSPHSANMSNISIVFSFWTLQWYRQKSGTPSQPKMIDTDIALRFSAMYLDNTVMDRCNLILSLRNNLTCCCAIASNNTAS